MRKLFFVMFICLAAVAFTAEKIEKDRILTEEGWQEIYQDFTVDPSVVEVLKSKTEGNLRIDVYLAFWCGDSRNNVPKFAKIINHISSSSLEVNYYLVERKPTKDTKYYVAELKVERVPTFIFYRDKKEIGRIIENPKIGMVEDFLEIIF